MTLLNWLAAEIIAYTHLCSLPGILIGGGMWIYVRLERKCIGMEQNPIPSNIVTSFCPLIVLDSVNTLIDKCMWVGSLLYSVLGSARASGVYMLEVDALTESVRCRIVEAEFIAPNWRRGAFPRGSRCARVRDRCGVVGCSWKQRLLTEPTWESIKQASLLGIQGTIRYARPGTSALKATQYRVTCTASIGSLLNVTVEES